VAADFLPAKKLRRPPPSRTDLLRFYGRERPQLVRTGFVVVITSTYFYFRFVGIVKICYVPCTTGA